MIAKESNSQTILLICEISRTLVDIIKDNILKVQKPVRHLSVYIQGNSEMITAVTEYLIVKIKYYIEI